MGYQILAGKFEGLEKYLDGVLGLQADSDFVIKMKQNGLIEKAIISFNIANGNPNEASYAIFGEFDPGYNFTTFKNANSSKWQL